MIRCTGDVASVLCSRLASLRLCSVVCQSKNCSSYLLDSYPNKTLVSTYRYRHTNYCYIEYCGLVSHVP
uniref:Uncharacterized protein n=1 Tax=Daphnia magna TaxID=35525 RepID=A0A0P6BXU0_9CRUS